MSANEITQEEKNRFLELQQMSFEFARNGETETLENMIKAGLDVNLTNTKGNSLLMLAAYNGNFETSQMLVENKADVNSVNDQGHSILAGVAFKGYLNIVKLLIENGATIDNRLSKSPLMFASMFGRVEVVKYLQALEEKSFKNRVFSLIAEFIGLFKKKK